MGGLVVNVGDQKFVLPLMSLITTLTINVNEIKNFHGKEMIKNGAEILPILRLSHILAINSMCDMLENEQVTLVIVEKDGKRYGLVVDSLEQEREIVVKRLDIRFDNSQTFSDATILPDGRVALILDPTMLI
jgi:two-component system chemotaxis sensor kinase CheA